MEVQELADLRAPQEVGEGPGGDGEPELDEPQGTDQAVRVMPIF